MEKNEKFTINYKDTWTLYPKNQVTEEGNNRVKRQYTITPETIEEFTDFQITHAGKSPQRGSGIASALVEFSIRLMMASIAEFKVDRIVNELEIVIDSPKVRKRVVANLRRIADLLA